MTHDFVLSCNIDDANEFVLLEQSPSNRQATINLRDESDYNRPPALRIV
jgi:hypothetical protein